MLETSLIHTAKEGQQEFVHDTLQAFFTVKHLIHQGGELSLRSEAIHELLGCSEPSSLAPTYIPQQGRSRDELIFYVGLSQQWESIVTELIQVDLTTSVLCFRELKKGNQKLEQLIVDKAIGHLLQDDQSLQWDASQALKLLQSPLFLEGVDPLFTHEKRTMREKSAEILASYQLDEVLPLLEHYSTHDDWRVRWNTIETARHYKSAKTRTLVDHLMHDPEDMVMFKASLTLGEWSPDKSKLVLVRYADNENEFVRKMIESLVDDYPFERLQDKEFTRLIERKVQLIKSPYNKDPQDVSRQLMYCIGLLITEQYERAVEIFYVAARTLRKTYPSKYFLSMEHDMKNLFVGLIGLQQLVQNNTYRDEVKKEYDAIRMQNLPKMIRYLGVSNLIKLEKLKK